MSDSLLVAGFETLGGTSQSTYKVSTGGLQFGAPEPDQATAASLLLDGDVVTGIRSKNRSITLPITVFATGTTSQAIRSALTSACDALLAAVDAQTFTLQWTPDGGLPIIWDCYRARGERQRSIVRDNQGVTMVTLTFQAKPFGRSTDVRLISSSSSLQIDSYDTPPTGGTFQGTNKVEGAGSAGVTSGTPISRSFAAKDLSPFAYVTLWQQVTKTGTGRQTVLVTPALTLTSASGSTKYNGTSLSFNVGDPWALLSIPLSGGTVTGGSGVTLSAVTSYSLTMTYSYGTAIGSVGTKAQYIDDLRATASSSTLIGPTTHAAVLSIPGVLGSARTPTNVTLTNGSTFVAGLLHSPPIDQNGQAQILSSLSGASTNQTVTIAAQNSGFRGTYTVMLGASSGPGGAVTTTVTITQKENGTAVGSPTVLTKIYTSGQHLIPIDEVTLPLYDTPDENTATSYTVQVQITGADRYSELMLLDTTGQTIWTDTDLATAVAALYIDEPSALQSGPPVYGSATDRTAAYGVLGNSVVTGGPILLEPGNNKFLAWVSAATPVVGALYYPRWQDERTA